ncbi:MAG TPA: Asp23/Gls24 family envelope stress response protein [Desulfotomaculum sp.]|nr:Asp23/Gls24 family envelope stress response protein [Desulfotomaculum sp.]
MVVKQEQTSIGSIRIADEVVRIIAGLAATEVQGVTGMSGGLAGGIAEILGRKNLSKGVKVEVGEKEAAVDIYVIVDYGAKIPDIASQIQQKVRKAVNDMTGLNVKVVNIHIQGVSFSGSDKEDEQRTK